MIIRQMYIIIDPEQTLMQNICIFAVVNCAVFLVLKLVQAIILHYKFEAN